MIKKKNIVFDVGSSKICCWVDDRKKIYSAHVASQGIWDHYITNLQALEEAIIRLIYDMEQHSGISVRTALVMLNHAFFHYEKTQLTLSLETGMVTKKDMAAMQNLLVKKDHTLIEHTPISFHVDDQERIVNPLGFMGEKITASFYTLWIQTSVYTSIMACFKRCGVQVSGIISATHASALSSLHNDEKEWGTVLIDCGASNTSMVFFHRGQCCASFCFPIGGHHMTRDLARGCAISIQHAERIKVLYGAAVQITHDTHETIPPLYNEETEDSSVQIQRSFLIAIVQARCEEIIHIIKNILESMHATIPTHRVILTGGAVQLPGLRELAQRILNKTVVIAEPQLLHGAHARTPNFTAVIGGLLYHENMDYTTQHEEKKQKSFFSWLKKNI